MDRTWIGRHGSVVRFASVIRLLHTADWHLGHRIYGRNRIAEHKYFLDWLVATVSARKIDYLLVAGDIFDTSHPSSEAMSLWYDFLDCLHSKSPHTKVVAIAGNHDSPKRLCAAQELLRRVAVTLVGPVRGDNNDFCVERCLVPIIDKLGNTVGCIAAIPFLRKADVPNSRDNTQSSILAATTTTTTGTTAMNEHANGWNYRYHQILTKARQVAGANGKLIVLGHGHWQGGRISPDSERVVMSTEGLPTDMLPKDADYVALGHLHMPQSMGPEHIRYSGSPLPMAMSEAQYQHQVLQVDVSQNEKAQIEEIAVPQLATFERIPSKGSLSTKQVIDALQDLPSASSRPIRNTDISSQSELSAQAHGPHYLQVAISDDKPVAQIREALRRALQGKSAILAKLILDKPQPSTPSQQITDLSAIRPIDMFSSYYKSQHKKAPSKQLLDTFLELVDKVQQQ